MPSLATVRLWNRTRLAHPRRQRNRPSKPAWSKSAGIFGVPGKTRAIVDLICKKFPRFLTMGVLMVGCAAGAGELGACDSKDELWLAKALCAVLLNYARQNKASLIVLKDFPAEYRLTLQGFAESGFTR